jgi:hypothetical protein
MKGPEPKNTQLPTDDVLADNDNYQTYKAAGKLKGKKTLIMGGDSGIGRAVAILFSMEGAEAFIKYLPEESDAQTATERVEKTGQKRHLSSRRCQRRWRIARRLSMLQLQRWEPLTFW